MNVMHTNLWIGVEAKSEILDVVVYLVSNVDNAPARPA